MLFKIKAKSTLPELRQALVKFISPRAFTKNKINENRKIRGDLSGLRHARMKIKCALL